MSEGQAFLRANFDWTVRLDAVWKNPAVDIPDLDAGLRDDISEEARELSDPGNPLGRIVLGAGGSGKTHLLGALRRRALENNVAFVLVDMTDVHDFCETVLLGYVNSLMQRDATGHRQFESLLAWIVDEVGAPKSGKAYLADMARCGRKKLNELMQMVVKAIDRKHPGETLRHQDVIRALFLMNSKELDIQSVGYSWLQAAVIEDEDRASFSFRAARQDAMGIINGLSWILSLRGPTLLALDQLDAFVGQQDYLAIAQSTNDSPETQNVAKAILSGIANGLSTLFDKTYRTLVLISCLESTLSKLDAHVETPYQARYRKPEALPPLNSKDRAQALVAARLAVAYDNVGFTPPYPTWPFAPEAFTEAVAGMTPRELLKHCEAHRAACRRTGGVTELHSFGHATQPPARTPDEFDALDRQFAELKSQAQPDRLLVEEAEDDGFAALLVTACQCLVKENPKDGDVDAIVDVDFAGGKTLQPLHARIRLVYHDQEGLEKHYCLRALQRTSARSYQCRLKAAMTTAGIDRSLPYRHLVLFRSTPLPGGRITAQLTDEFRARGGLIVAPGEVDVRTLWALQQMSIQPDGAFEVWLRSRQPVSKLTMVRQARLKKGDEEPPQLPITRGTDTKSSDTKGIPDGRVVPAAKETPEQMSARVPPSDAVSVTSSGPVPGTKLPVGYRLLGTAEKDAVELPIEAFRQHVLVLAGAGSGKTVLVRRIVEEVALLGVPAIVIDGANDLARMGEPWPETPAGWRKGDMEKAGDYFARTETVLWTPGLERGNPLHLEPLPDLAAVADDADELSMAVAMATETLQPIVAPGNSAASRMQLGVLSAALKFFAQNGGGRLREFTDLLGDLPIEAGGGISSSEKHASKMADLLRAKMQTDPLLRDSGTALDPAVLFGLDNVSGKTRISVISLVGLQGETQQQQFLSQLGMTLFAWLKKNPAPADKPLRGVLVLDEAKDFVPSQRASLCKNSFLRLAAQARKYGLGLIFATQAPKDIEHTIISNCFTHFYGQANSPAAIEVIVNQIKLKGGSGGDVAKLGRGRFYVHNADVMPQPMKVAAPLCLSYHPPGPLSPDEVETRARRSMNLLR